MKKIFPELISRRDVIADAVEQAIDMMYKMSYPSTSLEEIRAHISSLSEEEKFNYSMWRTHYLPKKLQDEIIEMFESAYKLKSELYDHVDLFVHYAFEDPIIEVYKKDKNGTSHREYDRVQKLDEIIGTDAANNVKDYVEKCKSFYNRDVDHETFKFNICDLAPCSSKKTVEDYYHKHGERDFKIDESIFPQSIYGDDEDDYEE